MDRDDPGSGGGSPAPPLRLPPVPAAPAAPDGGRLATVLPALLGAATGVGFALVAGDARYLLVSLAVAGLSVGAVLATRRARTSRDRRRADALRAAYLDQVAAVAGAAAAAARRQRCDLERLHPGPAAAAGPGHRTGSRAVPAPLARPGGPGFGALRIGVGEVDAEVFVQPPDELVVPTADAGLVEVGRTVAAASARLGGAPVVLPARPGASVAVVGDPDSARDLVRAWLVGAAACHRACDLAIGVVTAHGPDDPAWSWVRWLPHAGPGPEAGLARASRRVGPPGLAGPAAASQPPAGLLVLDGVPAEAAAPGVTALVLCGAAAEPASATAVVRIRPDGTVTLCQPGSPGAPAVEGIVPDRVDSAEAARLARALAAAESAGATTGRSAPAEPPGGAVRLSGLLGHRPLGPLAVPLGVSESGRPVVLDLAEAAAGGHGPHGLVLGATGTGKSELLRTLVVGLASGATPDRVAFLLVDFKGGAALDPLAALPHVTGLVTNLEGDSALAARVQDALDGELDDRQGRLRAAGAGSLEGFRAARRGGAEPLPSLVVVVDEFGELLELRPELLDTFGRVGRLGRSLGVHLLLSSQRLEEGRLRGLDAHLRFRIALRTFTAAESVAALGSTQAHALPSTPGAAILGVDGTTVRFQVATTSLPARPATDGAGAGTPDVVRRVGGPVAIAAPGRPDPPGALAGSELAGLTAGVVARGNRPARPLCPPPLPRLLSLAQLGGIDRREAGTHPDGPAGSTPGIPLGLADDARRRRQPVVRLDLGSGDCHVGVAGPAGSGRSTFLRTLASALTARHDPSRWQVLALDLGGGTLAALRQLPHTAVVAGDHDHDAVRRVADELEAVVAERSAALAAAGLTRLADLDGLPPDEAGSVLPDDRRARLLVLVDGYGRLRREHPDAEEALARVAASGRATGIHLGLTCSRWLDVRPALLDLLDVRLELGVADPGDSRWDRERLARVPPGPGGGLSPEGLPLRLARGDAGPPAVHPGGIRAQPVRTLPLVVRAADVLPAGTPTDGRFLLGVRERRLAPVLLDPAAGGAHLLVLGDAGSGRTTLLQRVARHLTGNGPAQRPARLHLVDPTRSSLAPPGLDRVDSLAYEARSTTRLVEALLDELRGRLPPPGLGHAELAARSWWTGPDHVLLVDDHDLVSGWTGTGHGVDEGLEIALAGLGALLPVARDVGLHVLLARSVTGLARASYDPLLSRLRDCAPTTLVLAGDRAEGPVAGDVCAAAAPPGRGRLVRTGRPPLLVQCCLPG